MDVATNPSKLNLSSTAHGGVADRYEDRHRQTVKAFIDLSVSTATCDKNRVIFMKMPGNFTYKNLGLTLESHSVFDRTGTPTRAALASATARDG